jgi:hypothetical protein
MDFNSYWYLGLGILSILLLVYVYIKTRSLRIFLLFVLMVGVGYIIEAVIYNFGHSYQYYPEFIKQNRIYDSNLGAIASNALALPAAATFIAVLRKNWKWIVFFICFFAGVEWLFLKLDIYKHNWWKTGYTSLGLPFYFVSAKVFYIKLSQPLKEKLHTLLLFLIISPISGTFSFLPIIFFSNRYYELGWFGNFSQDTTAFGAIYYLCASLYHVLILKIHWKRSWQKYVLTPICFYIITVILEKVGILHSQVWWDPWYYVILSVIVLKLTVIISGHLTNGPPKTPNP